VTGLAYLAYSPITWWITYAAIVAIVWHLIPDATKNGDPRS
jgi:hypothetical protein